MFVCAEIRKENFRRDEMRVDQLRNLLTSTGICGHLSYKHDIWHGDWNGRIFDTAIGS